ncbi:MAG TPA: bifunctional demethylmenaquinone methyltransferase/2-methoxy-6-polyprenyl-1,4-benzoquinol methylase UbiE [Bacteroidales bacterium]|nr:bifunctional demethylmenaquinone methyltransferase/2-methoxy-6-polyprenyl-1,4-benzoquinol methylase UbiE [Bacteroidales bacterium]
MIKPYTDNPSGKKEQVALMFNRIAKRYDFLNHFLSLGIDKLWRRKAVRHLQDYKNAFILDIATGTGDLAITALKLKPAKIIGIDISEEMLRKGVEKIKKKRLSDIIELKLGDSENLDFETGYFHAAMVAFGVRNFENLNRGLQEINRVLKNNGKLVVLEFSKPAHFPVKQLYQFYFRFILPIIGRIISKDQSAYTYLPESVNQFPQGKDFILELEKAGFKNCGYKKLSFGISSIYFGYK